MSANLDLEPLPRSDFSLAGKRYGVDGGTLHLIVPEGADHPTFRQQKPIDSHDAHLAIRVRSYRAAGAFSARRHLRVSADVLPRRLSGTLPVTSAGIRRMSCSVPGSPPRSPRAGVAGFSGRSSD
jgi:hypothetical protein